jgi:hypothetical protein
VLDYAKPSRRSTQLLRHVLIALGWLVAGAVLVAALLAIQSLLPVRTIPIPLVLAPVVFFLLPLLAYRAHRSAWVAFFVLVGVIVLCALAVAYVFAAGSVGDPNWK